MEETFDVGPKNAEKLRAMSTVLIFSMLHKCNRICSTVARTITPGKGTDNHGTETWSGTEP